jgi:hypothetical protein
MHNNKTESHIQSTNNSYMFQCKGTVFRERALYKIFNFITVNLLVNVTNYIQMRRIINTNNYIAIMLQKWVIKSSKNINLRQKNSKEAIQFV